MKYRFLFGQPVLPSRPSADGQRACFILGAYPSAFHVQWRSPERDLQIAAVAVDNEPEPFWEGNDEQHYFDCWLKKTNFSEKWGEVRPCGKIYGSSGQWVRDSVLERFEIKRSAAWITDCLDTYFESPKAVSQLKKSKDKLLDLVKNTYRVLLTRGMKGCYIYFMDKDTTKFYSSRMG